MMTLGEVAPLLRGFGIASAIAAPVLNVVDHQDDTGATATLSGGVADGFSTIYVQPFAGQLGAGDWTPVALISGNGSAPLMLPTGHYFAQARTSRGLSTASSNVVYFVVSDGLESIHTRCLSAVQARIRALELAGLPGANVQVEKLPLTRRFERGESLPAIVISPQRTAMPPTTGTNNLDDVQYDVLVTMFDRDNQEPTLQAGLDRHWRWREQIGRAFRNQRLSGVPEVIHAAVEPAEGLIDEAWRRELLVSAVLLRFTSRERRGLS